MPRLRISRLVERESNIFSEVANAPAVKDLLRRVEQGGALSLAGINVAAQPFVVALLHERFPNRTIIAVAAGVKAQEAFHQDLATWRATACGVQSPTAKAASSQPSAL